MAPASIHPMPLPLREAEPTIACPTCGNEIPLTQGLRADIEGSLRDEFESTLAARERDLQASYQRAIEETRRSAEREVAARTEKKLAQDLADLREQLTEQARELDAARQIERDLRKRERDLERKQADLELTVERTLAGERERLVAETEQRLLDEHRLKDGEKERQLADMRRQIEDLKRKADQGSQQLQGEAGEFELEAVLREKFPLDEVTGVSQGIRGADIHQAVVDARGVRAGSILWECKNAKNFSEGWITKLKEDQRAYRADVAVLVTAALPKGCSRFALMDGVVVAEFACAGAVAALVRSQILQLAQARLAATTKEEKLELLYRYLSGVEFRQRVEAVVAAFATMKTELDAERRAAERQWAKRTKQIETVTFTIAGMYGDLQGMVSLPPIQALELPEQSVGRRP